MAEVAVAIVVVVAEVVVVVVVDVEVDVNDELCGCSLSLDITCGPADLYSAGPFCVLFGRGCWSCCLLSFGTV